MKYLFTVAILAAGVLIYLGIIGRSESQPDPVLPNPVKNNTEWKTQTDEQAGVTIKITPLNLALQSAEWNFRVVMDTHSVDLNQDLAGVSVLIDGEGNEYPAVGWEGSPPGGHHREGTLKFAPINPMPGTITLKLSNIGGIKERILVWTTRP